MYFINIVLPFWRNKGNNNINSRHSGWFVLSNAREERNWPILAD